MRCKKVGRFGVASLCVLASCVSGRRTRSAGEVLRYGGVLFTAEGEGCRTWDVFPAGASSGRIVERVGDDAAGAESYDYFFTRDGRFVVDGPHFAPRHIDRSDLRASGEGGFWAADPARPAAGPRRWRPRECEEVGR